jgi:hypothetical protein
MTWACLAALIYTILSILLRREMPWFILYVGLAGGEWFGCKELRVSSWLPLKRAKMHNPKPFII